MTTTGRTTTKGDADPTGPIPPICLQNEMWLTSDYLTDPTFPGQGTVPRCYLQGTTFEFEFDLFLLLKLTCNCSMSPMMTWNHIAINISSVFVASSEHCSEECVGEPHRTCVHPHRIP